jgi:hypothetical protein
MTTVSTTLTQSRYAPTERDVAVAARYCASGRGRRESIHMAVRDGCAPGPRLFNAMTLARRASGA